MKTKYRKELEECEDDERVDWEKIFGELKCGGYIKAIGIMKDLIEAIKDKQNNKINVAEWEEGLNRLRKKN